MSSSASGHRLAAPAARHSRERPACPSAALARPRVCFVGLENLPVLSRDFDRHSIGGEQVQHTLIAKALARRGIPVSMIVADLGQPDRALIGGIECFKAHGLHEGLPVLRFLHPRLTKLWAALRRADADVYYVSCAGPQLGIVASFARLHGRRVVFRIAHDTDCQPDQLLIRFWRDKRLYEFGLRRADRVLAQSDQQSRALQSNYRVASTVARMLVEPTAQSLPFGARDIDVLWVNNLRPFKRPDLALELARRLPHARFHMVGGAMPGCEALFEQIQGEARQVSNLVFHGAIPYQQVNAFYDRARVFVNTSDSEGFPNSYLQAWRSGVPTLVFFDPDRLIEQNRLGVRANSVDDMAAEISALLSCEGRWQRASRRCRAFMEERYGEDAVLAPYLDAMGA
jgi:glycosyltransferase involved in cell wall biosynthesis